MASSGWYLDPDDPTRQRYYNGAQFMGNRRPAAADTAPFPDPLPVRRPRLSPPRDSGSGLRTASVFLWLFALVDFIGAVVVGTYLLTRTGCVVNPYDARLCMGTTHPYVAAGLGALAGGLAQSVVAGVVAQLCITVAGMRVAPAS